MTPEDRAYNIQVVEGLVEQTGVRSVWDMSEIAEQYSPPFAFDEDIAYSILGIVAMSSIMVKWPVVVNLKTISEMYELPMDEVEDYFDWLCAIRILRKS